MRSQRALDALNVCISDVRDGVGPYLAVFLAARSGFAPSQIGWILAAAGIASLLMVSPAGLIFDSLKSKRALLVAASAAIALFTVSITVVHGFWSVIGLQIGVGIASSFIGPGIIAVSAVSVARRVLPARIARNETFNHAGNFAAAALAGLLARTFTVNAVFILVVVMSVFTIISILALPAEENENPTTPSPQNQRPQPHPQHQDTATRRLFPLRSTKRQTKSEAIKELFRNKTFIEFLVLVAVYQIANACLLPLAAQAAEKASPDGGVRLLSIGIVLAQLTAIPVAWASGQVANRFSPRTCLAIGFASIVARAFIFSTTTDIHILMAAQVFDGVAAGVLAVAPILWLLKIVGRTGFLAFACGLMASAMGIGAAISNVLGGYLFQNYGAGPTFIGFALLAGALMIKLLLPAERKMATPLYTFAAQVHPRALS